MGLKDIFTKKRSYQAASKKSRLSSWFSGSGDANASIETSLKTLRERSRDLRRNNPYAKRGVDVITNNVIGKGISTQASNDNIQKIWNEWTRSTSIDFDGRHNLKGLQRLVMASMVESGEVFIRRRITAGLKYPVQYQVLESDFLDSTKTISAQSGNRVIQGIEFDSNGKRLGYWLYETHPGSIDSDLSLSSNFISADEIKHIYRQDRPGQVRGVPWLAPVMVKMRDLDDYEDAQLVRQKVAACFTAFVQDISADCMTEGESDSGEFGERLEPGTIEELPSGKTVTFADPPTVENYQEFTSAQIRAISIGLGLSFEAFSGDLSQTNYSSARMGRIEMDANVSSWRQDVILTQMMDPIVNDFNFMLAILGKSDENNTMTHTPPKREMIDPGKEGQALIDQVRAGLTSRSKVITAMGDDPDEVYAQIQKDNEKADNMGLILDSDPRYTTSNGKKQEVANDKEENQDQ